MCVCSVWNKGQQVNLWFSLRQENGIGSAYVCLIGSLVVSLSPFPAGGQFAVYCQILFFKASQWWHQINQCKKKDVANRSLFQSRIEFLHEQNFVKMFLDQILDENVKAVCVCIQVGRTLLKPTIVQEYTEKASKGRIKLIWKTIFFGSRSCEGQGLQFSSTYYFVTGIFWFILHVQY